MSLVHTHHGSTTPCDPTPPPAPPWARRSLPDSGGITHETDSYVLAEAIRDLDLNRYEFAPTEVAMSVSDQRINGQWQRRSPTIHLEGGSYSLDAARRLCAAIGALLDIEEGATRT